ncbi:MAG: hypothetical protein JEY94_17805 [Melioribacteraceae bacterium]|nr:hypothetical protein [Melioribacteraceae bacterium]
MIKSREVSDVNPICPFCEKELHEILIREIETTFGKRYVYFCAECKKVLGVSQRKGFWMG